MCCLDKQINDLSQSLVDKLSCKNLTIATAESCTGGMLSSSISNISGSSKVFEFGMVTYSNKIKNQKLFIPNEILNKYGAVSPQTAKLMAKNITKISDSNIGVSITGLAGPNGDGSNQKIGTVFISVCENDNIKTKKFLFNNSSYSRIKIKKLSTINALKMILNIL